MHPPGQGLLSRDADDGVAAAFAQDGPRIQHIGRDRFLFGRFREGGFADGGCSAADGRFQHQQPAVVLDDAAVRRNDVVVFQIDDVAGHQQPAVQPDALAVAHDRRGQRRVLAEPVQFRGGSGFQEGVGKQHERDGKEGHQVNGLRLKQVEDER